jgi:ATP-dependent Lhr-like helicase
MPQNSFHPVIQEWWASHIQAPPTAVQTSGWEAIRAGRDTLLAAPTGSGKTLAAFLHSIDALFREGVERGGLEAETRIIYVSPLKALSSDIHKNLAEPRRQISEIAESHGLPPVRITAAVRSGDTPSSERAAMLRKPPHILVTTPESLYLLLTAERSRAMLSTATTVIVDEIHAVVESRRGAHLALSLERLDHVAGKRLQRIGLSATQKPIAQIAEFLVGTGTALCDVSIVDEGHVRALDLAMEIPQSPLEVVMSADVWQENYDRLAQLASEHGTTLIFVNTRRLAERVAHNLEQRLGKESVAAHHGSLAKEARLDAEERLKAGRLKVLVATSSLELGIDIGHVDLVCQLGSPRRIAAFLQRVGRSGHTVGGTPKGRLFPVSRDDLVECAALLRAVRERELDHVIIPKQPLDVLSQQIAAEVASAEWDEAELYDLVTRAYPYRKLSRPDFDEVVRMLARGYTTRRGRQGALVHYDAVERKLRPRASTRMAAIMSGGAIPEVFDYRVVLEPEGTFVGTLNEDFAIESVAGDVFLLGNHSWRIVRVGTGVVYVADAEGQPPSLPFWLGEAPSRTDELSARVAELRARVETLITSLEITPAGIRMVQDTIAAEYEIPSAAAWQIVLYLSESLRILGALPTQDTIVLERFFDEAGGMQLVLHAPFGARVNRAWGLSLRKKFCQNFNFELQAVATDEGVLLSLGPQHSFPLDDVFRYLNPSMVRETLVQAVLDSPIFLTRWRWVGTLSLAVPRLRKGARIPGQIQRMISEDLLSAVFPDATACLEHVAGDREVPDHPLVTQAITDCLEEAMDLPQLMQILQRVLSSQIRCVSRDTPEPSPLSHGMVNSAVYTFLDGAPLEERRTHAVYTRRALEPSAANDLGALDIEAIERVRAEAWPDARDADELHDALLGCGFVLAHEALQWSSLLDGLVEAGRVVRASLPSGTAFIAVERWAEARALWNDVRGFTAGSHEIRIPVEYDREWDAADAAREMLRGRMEIVGPQTSSQITASFGVDASVIDLALVSLETEGIVLRGSFTAGESALEWCNRRLLARIHRYTLNRLRAEIQPASASEFMRFLFRWQRVEPGHRVRGSEGVASVVEQLAGFEIAAGAWEREILASRCDDYEPALLDMLCMTGRVAWGRISPSVMKESRRSAGPLRASPIALMPRQSVTAHSQLVVDRTRLNSYAREVLETLEARGALFFHEIVATTRLIPTQVEEGLAELAAVGAATSDSFTGLRALLIPPSRRASLSTSGRSRRRGAVMNTIETAGRWSVLRPGADATVETRVPTYFENAADVERYARMLLKRYGVVFRRLLTRESSAPAWRDLLTVYRRLEARGEIRGGRFLQGPSGEQFALTEAVGLLRSIRKEPLTGDVTVISGVDPLNLVGIVTPEDRRVPAITRNRVLYRDGVPIASIESGEVIRMGTAVELSDDEMQRAARHGAGTRAPTRSAVPIPSGASAAVEGGRMVDLRRARRKAARLTRRIEPA